LERGLESSFDSDTSTDSDLQDYPLMPPNIWKARCLAQAKILMSPEQIEVIGQPFNDEEHKFRVMPIYMFRKKNFEIYIILLTI
jgi:hypothetical protein